MRLNDNHYHGKEHIEKLICQEIRRFRGNNFHQYDLTKKAFGIIQDVDLRAKENNAMLLVCFEVKKGLRHDHLRNEILLSTKDKFLRRKESLYLRYEEVPRPPKTKEHLQLEEVCRDIGVDLGWHKAALDVAIDKLIDNGVCCNPDGECVIFGCHLCYWGVLLAATNPGMQARAREQ